MTGNLNLLIVSESESEPCFPAQPPAQRLATALWQLTGVPFVPVMVPGSAEPWCVARADTGTVLQLMPPAPGMDEGFVQRAFGDGESVSLSMWTVAFALSLGGHPADNVPRDELDALAAYVRQWLEHTGPPQTR